MQYISQENRDYLRIMAKSFDETELQLLDKIITAHRKKNGAIYDRAKRQTAAGGKLSLMKL